MDIYEHRRLMLERREEMSDSADVYDILVYPRWHRQEAADALDAAIDLYESGSIRWLSGDLHAYLRGSKPEYTRAVAHYEAAAGESIWPRDSHDIDVVQSADVFGCITMGGRECAGYHMADIIVMPALEAARQVILKRGVRTGPCWDDKTATPGDIVIEWNDTVCRSRSDALQLLRDAWVVMDEASRHKPDLERIPDLEQSF